MEYKVECSNRKLKRFVEAVLPSMMEQLGLTRSRAAVLIKVTDDVAEGCEGSVLQINEADCSLLLIRPPKRITDKTIASFSVALAHEMVHVKQYAKGQMVSKGSNKCQWMGRVYNMKKTPYLDMPWEVEAFSRQELIARRALV